MDLEDQIAALHDLRIEILKKFEEACRGLFGCDSDVDDEDQADGD